MPQSVFSLLSLSRTGRRCADRIDRLDGRRVGRSAYLPGPPDVRVRRRAVDQPERHARVRGVQDRALTLDPEQLAAARDALEDELLRGPGEEVGDDGVDRDPPAGDRDPRLPGRDELAPHAAAA